MGARAIVLGALLVATTLVGCIGDDVSQDPIEPTDVQVPPDPLAFANVTQLPQDTSSAEPNMAIMDDGTIFVTAPTGASPRPNAYEGSAWLWRSTDGGESWDTLRSPHTDEPLPDPPVATFCSCDADVVTSPDGWVYYSDWWIAGFAAGNYLVEASPDGGETWNKAPVTIPEPTSVDRQWLVAGEDGFVGLFYSYFGLSPIGNEPLRDAGLAGRQIQAVFSTDHGQTWSPPVDVVPAQEGWAYQIAHPRVLPDGTIVMPYGAVDVTTEGGFFQGESEVRLAVSTDQGQSWAQRTAAQAPEGFDNLWAVQGATDAAGTTHVGWAARTGENITLYHTESPDAGESWSEPTPVRSTGINVLPWVAAWGNGTVALGWYGGNTTGDPVEASDDATWYAYVAERNGTAQGFQAQRVDHRPVKEGPLCPRGASCEDDRELLDYVSLDYGPDGQLHYTFARSDTVTDADIPALVHHAAELG